MALKPRQLALIEAMIAHPSASHIELAEAVEANRNTITKWKRDPEFQAAYQERLREVWKDGEAIAIKSMLKLANEGHYQASAYILDNLGYKPTNKIEADINQDIIITIGGSEND